MCVYPRLGIDLFDQPGSGFRLIQSNMLIPKRLAIEVACFNQIAVIENEVCKTGACCQYRNIAAQAAAR